jgi:hypothetical protein
MVEEGGRTCLGNRQPNALFFYFLCVPFLGKFLKTYRDVHYSQILVRKLPIDVMTTRIYGKHVEL